MSGQNHDKLQADIEKKYKRRDKKKKRVMKISGASAKKLQEIISRKS